MFTFCLSRCDISLLFELVDADLACNLIRDYIFSFVVCAKEVFLS